MRILLVTVRSDFGGGPKHVDQIISGLSDQFDIYVAAPAGEPFGSLWVRSEKIKGFLELPFRSFSIRYFLRLLRFIRRNRICLLHSHGNGAGFYTRLAKLVYPSLYVIHTFHGIVNLYDSVFKRVMINISGRVFKYFTDWSVFVSKGESLLGLKLKFARTAQCSVIYNGIDPQVNTALPWQRSGLFKIVSLTRFDFAKNMSMAYEIAKRLQKFEDIQFVWVGDGPDFLKLKTSASKDDVKNIDFVGFSNNPHHFLSEANVYLSTSRFEGLPYGMIEAASFGLPIVATDVRGNNEVAFDSKNSILFNSIEEGVQGILSFYSSEARRREASEYSLSIFNENFILSGMLKNIRELYMAFKN